MWMQIFHHECCFTCFLLIWLLRFHKAASQAVRPLSTFHNCQSTRKTAGLAQGELLASFGGPCWASFGDQWIKGRMNTTSAQRWLHCEFCFARCQDRLQTAYKTPQSKCALWGVSNRQPWLALLVRMASRAWPTLIIAPFRTIITRQEDLFAVWAFLLARPWMLQMCGWNFVSWLWESSNMDYASLCQQNASFGPCELYFLELPWRLLNDASLISMPIW